MDTEPNEIIRQTVRSGYAAIAQGKSGCCCGSSSPDALAGAVGYTEDELALLPDGANMGLSCGNPTALADLKPGQTVLDLGSGGGFDVFIAARKVGPTGRAIGVDMTPEMLSKARAGIAVFSAKTGLSNVEFRLGEIEHLPVADASVDVVISNCVVNLSPDKPAVMREAYRVLRAGGRLAIADTVATGTLPEQARQDLALWSCCIAGASTVDEWHALLAEAGFVEIRVVPKESSRALIATWAPGSRAEDHVLSATIQAIKPGAPSAASCC